MLEVLRIFGRLGLTSFGGPVAHLAFFRAELVQRRGWLEEAEFADTVALCQLLPGPSSSQVAVCLGSYRAGPAGAVAAWLGFTLPSALLMAAWAYGLEALPAGNWLHGLKLVTLAVVAQAVWSMGRQLCPDRLRRLLALLIGVLALAYPSFYGQLASLVVGALVGLACYAQTDPVGPASRPAGLPARGSLLALGLFVSLLVLAHLWPAPESTFFLTGSLVFGGGHVILPLLENAVCGPGWVSTDVFLAGYGAAQAVPGPLFSFGAYLGTVIGGWPRGCSCLVALYLPSFLLLGAVLPHWHRWRRSRWLRSALVGVNAAVVGLLLAALLGPVGTQTITGPQDVLLAGLAWLLLRRGAPPWLVVLLGAGYGTISTGQGH
ncbi:MAG: chromate efflux transporter [Vulcanimicrobiota bacterium]